ncbi:MAG: S8 family serine peptidase [Phaeodactylibacter sp.]|nr:S8 family serine peptidase [Phaeodactylibacter sp.]
MKTLFDIKTLFICLNALFFLILTSPLEGQSLPPVKPEKESDILRETNSKALLEWAKRDSLRYYGERARAEAFARNIGYPIRGKNGNGGEFELQGFDESGQLKYYITNNRVGASTISTDEVWPGGSAGTALTGQDFVISIWEGSLPRNTHNELIGKVTLVDNDSGIGDHATHVTGTAIARGNRPSARGMAYNARSRNFTFNNDLSEMANEAAQGRLVSNHSYGMISGWNYNTVDDRWEWWGNTSYSNNVDYKFGYYDSEAADADFIVFNAPFYLPVKSAGNDRNDDHTGTHWVRNAAGVWVQSNASRPPDGGSSGYDCIPTMGTAKNILTVGAVEELPGGYGTSTNPGDVDMSSFSSWGPTDDGRIKPDLVAKGVAVESCTADGNNTYDVYSGTSMSAPMVSGSILLIQEHIANLFPGAALRASAMKALLIHTADECGTAPGPDYSFGWGLMNTQKAVEFLTDAGGRHWFNTRDSINNGDSRGYTFEHDGIGGIRITIAWTDPPGDACPPPYNNSWTCTDKMLINDLDLRLVRLSDDTVYFPWRLNPASPSSAATRGDNDRDNVEQVFADDLPAGEYAMVITHKGTLVGGRQIFSIMLSGLGDASVASACNQAIDIQCGQTLEGSTAGEAQPVFECGTELNTAPGQWFHFTGNGTTVTATTCSSETDYDTKLAVFSGSCDNLICEGGIDDDGENCSVDGLLSTVEFFAESGTEYFIYVTGYDDASGSFALSIDCQGGPACAPPQGLVATEIGHAYFIIYWNTVADADLYQAQVRQLPNGGWLLSNEYSNPGIIFGNRVPNTDYEVQIRSKCDDTYSSWSPSIFLTTLGEGNPYCFSYGLSWNYWIDRLVFAGLDHESGTDYGYNDFSGQLVAEVEAGEAYALSLYPGQRTTVPNLDGVWWKIWIDWNQDNSFSEVDEVFHSQSSDSQTAVTANKTIPSNIGPGEYRMRVSYRASPDDSPNPSPCQTRGNMEVEDYTIRVTGSSQPPAAAFSASATCGQAPLTVSFTDNSSNAPDNWQWNFGNGQSSTQQNPTVTYNTPGIYNVSLTAGNAAGSDTEMRNAYITVVAPVSVNAPSGTTACLGDALTLTASGASTYSWTGPGLDNASGATVQAAPGQAGTYTYEVIGTTNGCSSEPASISLSFSAPPQVSITPDAATACLGETVTLTASGASAYTWTGPGLSATSGDVVQATPSQAGSYTYQAVGTSGGCASEPASVTVDFTAAPQTSVTASAATACLGETVTLTASGASAYTWTGTGLSATSGDVVQATPTQPGSYTYQAVGTSGGCASGPASVTVNFTAVPQATVTASATAACLGEAVTLTASGASAYTWTGMGLSSTGGTVVQASPTQPGNYTYQVVGSGNNCSGPAASISVQFTTVPVVEATASLEQICQGDAVALTASGADTYTWQGPGLSATTGSTVSATPTAPGLQTYQVTGTSSGCRSAPATVSVAVQNIPLVNISASATASCVGQPITLTASGAGSYAWTGAGLNSTTGAVVEVSPEQAGSYTYQVTGSDGNCGSAPQTISLQFNSPPQVSLTASAASLCEGQSLTLSANGASTYSWSGPGIGGSSGSSVTTTPATVGISTYQVTGSANGCTSLPVSVEVEILPIPVLSAQASANPACLGDTLLLQASGASQYFWNGPGLLSFSGPSVQAVPEQAGQVSYQLSGSSGGCQAEPASLQVTVEHHPLSVEVEISDCTEASILFEAGVTNGGAQPNITWYYNGQAAWSGPTYTLFGPQNGDEVYCEVTAVNAPACTAPLTVQSEVLSVDCLTPTREIRELESIRLFPNPNPGRFALELHARQAFAGRITIFNSLGQAVLSRRLEVQPGEQQILLNLPGAAAGLYHLAVASPEGMRAVKFMVE